MEAAWIASSQELLAMTKERVEAYSAASAASAG